MEIRTADGRYESRSYIANPAQQWGSTAPLANGQLGMTSSGAQVSTQTALQLAAVFGSTSLISDSIATLPIRQWKLNRSGEPVAVDSSMVIAQPSAEMTQRDFITQGTMSYLIAGNLYGLKLGVDDMMLPTQVQMMNPDHVRVRRNPTSGAIEFYYGNSSYPVDDDLVIHGMGRSLPGEPVGMNPIAYMRNALGVALSQDRMSGAYFANSAQPHGVVNLPGEFDPNEVQAFKQSWLEAHQGTSHAYLPGILTGGATYSPIAVSMQDAQFLEQMQYSASVISGMIYRVPPHMLGMVDKDTSWGAGIEQQEIGFVKNTLGIWLERWEDLLSSWLPTGQFVTFDLSRRLRGDTLQRYSAYQIGRVIGSMNSLEIMQAEGQTLPTDPEVLALLSKYDQPLNSSPVKPTSTGGAGGDKAD